MITIIFEKGRAFILIIPAPLYFDDISKLSSCGIAVEYEENAGPAYSELFLF